MEIIIANNVPQSLTSGKDSQPGSPRLEVVVRAKVLMVHNSTCVNAVEWVEPFQGIIHPNSFS